MGMSDLRLNILGDTTYGKGRINTALRDQYGLPRLCLHAWRLSLVHPVKNEEVVVEVVNRASEAHAWVICLQEPIPQDLRDFLENLPNAPRHLINTI
eukprot:764091-Hanusia_phi.AAC.28